MSREAFVDCLEGQCKVADNVELKLEQGNMKDAFFISTEKPKLLIALFFPCLLAGASIALYLPIQSMNALFC